MKCYTLTERAKDILSSWDKQAPNPRRQSDCQSLVVAGILFPCDSEKYPFALTLLSTGILRY